MVKPEPVAKLSGSDVRPEPRTSGGEAGQTDDVVIPPRPGEFVTADAAKDESLSSHDKALFTPSGPEPGRKRKPPAETGEFWHRIHVEERVPSCPVIQRITDLVIPLEGRPTALPSDPLRMGPEDLGPSAALSRAWEGRVHCRRDRLVPEEAYVDELGDLRARISDEAGAPDLRRSEQEEVMAPELARVSALEPAPAQDLVLRSPSPGSRERQSSSRVPKASPVTASAWVQEDLLKRASLVPAPAENVPRPGHLRPPPVAPSELEEPIPPQRLTPVSPWAPLPVGKAQERELPERPAPELPEVGAFLEISMTPAPELSVELPRRIP